MPKKRLTAQMLERLTPPAKGQVEYFDLNMPGFALRVSYSGTKAWILMTRVKGKQVRLTLGEWPTMSLAEAHQSARTAKFHAKGGRDPRELRQESVAKAQTAERLTFGILGDEFLERYAKPKLRAKTIIDYRRTLKGSRTLAWQNKPIAAITRRDVMSLLDAAEAIGQHATAKLLLAYLRKFFSWCAEREVITENPTDRLKLNGTLKPRERALHVEELRRVWNACDKVGSTGAALVKILILTGQRCYETSVMRWKNVSGVDGPAPLWSIPADVTKNHRPHQVPLVPAAAAIARTQPLISADLLEKGMELVFTTNGSTPFSGWSKLKLQIDKRLKDDGQGPVPPWTFHDLRRSLVTGLHEHGLASPHVIEAIVNHVSGTRGGIAGVYNRAVYMDERRRALEAWASLICDQKAPANVISITSVGARVSTP